MRVLCGKQDDNGCFRLRSIGESRPGESREDAIIRVASERFEVLFNKEDAFRSQNGVHGGSIGRFLYYWNENWDGGALFVERGHNVWVIEAR